MCFLFILGGLFFSIARNVMLRNIVTSIFIAFKYDTFKSIAILVSIISGISISVWMTVGGWYDITESKTAVGNIASVFYGVFFIFPTSSLLSFIGIYFIGGCVYLPILIIQTLKELFFSPKKESVNVVNKSKIVPEIKKINKVKNSSKYVDFFNCYNELTIDEVIAKISEETISNCSDANISVSQGAQEFYNNAVIRANNDEYVLFCTLRDTLIDMDEFCADNTSLIEFKTKFLKRLVHYIGFYDMKIPTSEFCINRGYPKTSVLAECLLDMIFFSFVSYGRRSNCREVLSKLKPCFEKNYDFGHNNTLIYDKWRERWRPTYFKNTLGKNKEIVSSYATLAIGLLITAFVFYSIYEDRHGQCEAITKAGEQCSRDAEYLSDYCWQHENY